MTSNKENLIKSKSRVEKHGEVFTPKKIVNQMISIPGLKEKIEELEATILEPAVGEGVFLVEILKRRLDLIEKEYPKDLTKYENLALLSLSTLYGIELLEDNAQKCVMNIYETFLSHYSKYLSKLNKKPKKKVLDSGKTIISANIVQGDFLTKKNPSGEPMVFSEWKIIESSKKNKNLKVQRTEFTIDEIIENINKKEGVSISKLNNYEQTSFLTPEIKEVKTFKYTPVKITDVYREEMEEEDEIST